MRIKWENMVRHMVWRYMIRHKILVVTWLRDEGWFFPSLIQGMLKAEASLEELAEAEAAGYKCMIILPHGRNTHSLGLAVHEAVHHMLARAHVPPGRVNETIAYTVQWLTVGRYIHPNGWKFLRDGVKTSMKMLRE